MGTRCKRALRGNDDDNFMYQSSYSKTILKNTRKTQMKINANQASILYKNYKAGKLNKQNNFYNIPFYGRVKSNP